MVIDSKDLPKAKSRFKNKRTVLVGGCFDVFHFGHLQFLKKAKEQGDYLIVLLESDDFIRRRKKRVPVHNQNERAEILNSNESVDLVVKISPIQDKEYWSFVQQISPEVIAVTKGDKYINEKKRQAESVGGELKVVTPHIKDFSSTKITKHASISGS